ncbi:MAG: hypothetical protein JRG84_10955 [Deltaproteobacteria bacterium]|nr:hypothetical protein [Deltaproteobacteria bacterium]
MAEFRAVSLTLLILSGLLSFAIAEMFLRVATPFPISARSNRQPHPELGYVIDPALPDVDAAGFRNAGTSLARAELAVIGDSHTYGYNVRPEESFPALLARRTGHRVYNLSIPSFGIYHYLVLLERAAASDTPQVLLALYPANDLVLHTSITRLPTWPARARTLGLDWPAPDPDAPLPAAVRPPALFSTAWLRENSAVVSAFQHLVWERLRVEPVFTFPAGQQVAVGRVEKHARASSLDDTAIERAFRHSIRVLERGHSLLQAAGSRLAVLILPSRERVLLAWAQAAGHPLDPRFETLVANENRLVQAYLEFLAERGIPHHDGIHEVARAFARTVEAGEAFYPDHDDAHPFPVGYAAYAEAAERLLVPKSAR